MTLLFQSIIDQTNQDFESRVFSPWRQNLAIFRNRWRYCFKFFASNLPMEIELELYTEETDAIAVMQKSLELAKKAKELGFSIKELEIESEDDEEEK